MSDPRDPTDWLQDEYIPYSLDPISELSSFANAIQAELSYTCTFFEKVQHCYVMLDGIPLGPFRFHTLEDAVRLIGYLRRYMAWFGIE